MKKINLYFIMMASFVLVRCATTYELRAPGESFDALTQITSGNDVAIMPNGGDYGSNLVYAAKNADGYYNIFMKDNVLTKAVIQKTAGSNFDLAPSINTESGRIVFQRFNGFNTDISYIDAFKGKAITTVTNDDLSDYNPSWSDDGKKIIFERGAVPKLYIKVGNNNEKLQYKTVTVTQNQIWIKNLETGELKMIGEGSYPRFSSNGIYIVYVKYELDPKSKTEVGTIWTMNAEGERQKQLTIASMGYATHPNWSPDGSQIVFQMAVPKKNPDIYTVDIDGENLKQHTSNPSSDFFPYWSDDGYIYFSSDRNGKAYQFQIWRFKIEN
jgi:Tol biopolymer transport system component